MPHLITVYIERIVEILGALGYPGVFLLSFLDRLTVFLVPAEVVLPAFGILISQGTFLFWPVMIWTTLGNFLGNLLLYYIFFKGGRLLLEKYGRYVLISKHDLNHLDNLFSKYGNKILLIGYLIPTAVRSLIPIPAGITRMPLGRFALYTFIGSLPLNVLYILAGMKAGDHFQQILGYFEKVGYVIVALVVAFGIWYVYRHIRGKHATHN